MSVKFVEELHIEPNNLPGHDALNVKIAVTTEGNINLYVCVYQRLEDALNDMACLPNDAAYDSLKSSILEAVARMLDSTYAKRKAGGAN